MADEEVLRPEPAEPPRRSEAERGCTPTGSSPARKYGIVPRASAQTSMRRRGHQSATSRQRRFDDGEELEGRARQRTGTKCSGTPSRVRERSGGAVVAVEQLDHAGRLAEREDPLLDAFGVDGVDQPDAAVRRRARADVRAGVSHPAEARIRLVDQKRTLMPLPAARRRVRTSPRAARRARAACESSRKAGTAFAPIETACGSRRRCGHGNGRWRGRRRRRRRAAELRGQLAQDVLVADVLPSAQYASISRSCVSSWRPRSRASSSAQRALRVRDDVGMWVVLEPAPAKKRCTRSVIALRRSGRASWARGSPRAGTRDAGRTEPETLRRTGARAKRPSGWPRDKTVRCSRSRSRSGRRGHTSRLTASASVKRPRQSAQPTTAPSQPSSRSARRSSSEATPPAAITGRSARHDAREQRQVGAGERAVAPRAGDEEPADAGRRAARARARRGGWTPRVQPSTVTRPSRASTATARRLAERAAAAEEGRVERSGTDEHARSARVERGRDRLGRPVAAAAWTGNRWRPRHARRARRRRPGTRRRGRPGGATRRRRPRTTRGRDGIAAFDRHALAAALGEPDTPAFEHVDRGVDGELLC